MTLKSDMLAAAKKGAGRILKACHVNLTSGHMGVKRTSHRVLERFFWKGIIKDIGSMNNISHFSLHVYASYTDLYL